MSATFLITLVILCPLIGFLCVGPLSLFQRNKEIERFAQGFTCSAIGISCIAAWGLMGVDFWQGTDPLIIDFFPWIEVGSLKIQWGIYFDRLTWVMFIVITTLSFLIHLYSVEYMMNDHSIPRFMSYLSLFTFMILLLVSAPNLGQLFFGWEGVSLVSYLLIGFWYGKPLANAAAFKAFIMNRVSDLGLLMAIGVAFYVTKSLQFSDIFSNVDTFHKTMIYFGPFGISTLSLMCIFLTLGAMGKSAQFGFHTWLPDAMEAPLPVSTLIHSATMVTAGVFLLLRCEPLISVSIVIGYFLIIIGLMTSLFAAYVALTQRDIKRVIAFSTCSQLGYMFLAIGCKAYPVALFHLASHACLKALLFLSAGSVIHGMSGEQDIFQMGGLYKLMPFTYVMVWIGNLALAGFPFFIGYYSKDAILACVYFAKIPFAMEAFFLSLIITILTVVYSWRFLYLIFHGKVKAHERVIAHVHDSHWFMRFPILVLAAMTIFSGVLSVSYFLHNANNFWGGLFQDYFSKSKFIPMFIPYSLLIASVIGISIPTFFYIIRPQLIDSVTKKFKSLYSFSYHKGWIDELYKILWVNPAFSLGRFFWYKVDQSVIDQFGPDGIALTSRYMSRVLLKIQSGYLYHYVSVMVIGFVMGLFLLFLIKGY